VPIVANCFRRLHHRHARPPERHRIRRADHLIYGWVFFGFRHAAVVWIGARWRQDEAPVPADPQAGTSNIALPGQAFNRRIAALITLLVVAAGPVWAAYLDDRASSEAH